MQWIGALLFVITSTWVGFEWSSRLSNRPKQIRQLKNALQILEAEILYSQLPLNEAFLVIAKQTPQPISKFFDTLYYELEQDKR
ncbi:stage III sporulation protein SpoAB, partial [Domibacillus sp. 8LH]